MGHGRLPYVVTRAPARNELFGDFVNAEVVVHEHLDLQLIAHQVVRKGRPKPAVYDHDGPVGYAVHTHTEMFRQEIVRLPGKLDATKGNRCSDKEYRTTGCLRRTYERRHFRFGVACDLRGNLSEVDVLLADGLGQLCVRRAFLSLQPSACYCQSLARDLVFDRADHTISAGTTSKPSRRPWSTSREHPTPSKPARYMRLRCEVKVGKLEGADA